MILHLVPEAYREMMHKTDERGGVIERRWSEPEQSSNGYEPLRPPWGRLRARETLSAYVETPDMNIYMHHQDEARLERFATAFLQVALQYRR